MISSTKTKNDHVLDYEKIILEKALGFVMVNSVCFGWGLSIAQENSFWAFIVLLFSSISCILFWWSGSTVQDYSALMMMDVSSPQYTAAYQKELKDLLKDEDIQKMPEDFFVINSKAHQKVISRSASSREKTSENILYAAIAMSAITLLITVLAAFGCFPSG